MNAKKFTRPYPCPQQPFAKQMKKTGQIRNSKSEVPENLPNQPLNFP